MYDPATYHPGYGYANYNNNPQNSQYNPYIYPTHGIFLCIFIYFFV